VGGDDLVTEKHQNPVSRYQKTGNKVHAEKPQQMFIYCEQNVEEYHNLKVSKLFVWS